MTTYTQCGIRFLTSKGTIFNPRCTMYINIKLCMGLEMLKYFQTTFIKQAFIEVKANTLEPKNVLTGVKLKAGTCKKRMVYSDSESMKIKCN